MTVTTFECAIVDGLHLVAGEVDQLEAAHAVQSVALDLLDEVVPHDEGLQPRQPPEEEGADLRDRAPEGSAHCTATGVTRARGWLALCCVIQTAPQTHSRLCDGNYPRAAPLTLTLNCCTP